jgi:hypothetical protein
MSDKSYAKVTCELGDEDGRIACSITHVRYTNNYADEENELAKTTAITLAIDMVLQDVAIHHGNVSDSEELLALALKNSLEYGCADNEELMAAIKKWLNKTHNYKYPSVSPEFAGGTP